MEARCREEESERKRVRPLEGVCERGHTVGFPEWWLYVGTVVVTRSLRRGGEEVASEGAGKGNPDEPSKNRGVEERKVERKKKEPRTVVEGAPRG